jgi:pimeloyl-ACP methyl ester carboxylesterase
MLLASLLAALTLGPFNPGVSGPAPAQGELPGAARPKASQRPVQLDTTAGRLDGTLDLPAGVGPFPVVILIAGSGPTDRDGNQPRLKNDSLKQLGRGLAARGIAVLRYDRRGVGKSAAAQPTEKTLRFEMLVADAVGWIQLLRKDRRFSAVGVVGHSEGSLVGMLAAREGEADAFVALAGCGRPAAEVLRWQLARNLPAPLKAKCDGILDELAAGRTVAEPPKELWALFRPSVQPYLISYFRYDPSREIARLEVPVLIVQGTTDLQTPVEEAKRLAQAKRDARLCLIEGMNHVLKRAATAAEQRAAYADPAVPLAPGLVEAVSTFLSRALAKR